MHLPPSEWPTWVSATTYILLGAVACGINAVAGGGSLISFPALVAMGFPPLQANATNASALWVGSFASAYGFKDHLPEMRKYLRLLAPATVLGATAGSLLLLNTPDRLFRTIVPVLILAAALLLWFQPRMKALAEAKGKSLSPWGGAFVQFCIALYGGYFGAGMGILMLACFGLLMHGDIHRLNAIKTWLGVLINAIASFVFLVKGLVDIGPWVFLVIGSLMGGYSVAIFSQRIDSEKLRIAIVVFGLFMAGWFGYREFVG